MAEPLKQLDLFGMEGTTPVHIAAPKQAKSIKQKKSLPQYRKPVYQTESVLVETTVNESDADLPSVSRTPMAYVNRNILHKRGRMAFADMDQEIDKINSTVEKVNDNKFKRCFKAVPETFRGKPSGNYVLNDNCRFCDYRFECWPTLQELPSKVSQAKVPKTVSYIEVKEY
mgnify:CR=1 FL=1